MRSLSNAVLLSWMLIFLASCAAGQQAGWNFQKDAISLSFEADTYLNWRAGAPHTLALCVYQLREPGAFKGLAGNEDGLYRLLQCTGFDRSVVGARRVIVHPGKSQRIILDRVEGARFVAVVAGYYTIDKDRIVRIFGIPQQEKGMIFKAMAPAPFNASIRLGPKGILPSRES